jgi:hypothetical protein
MEPLVLVYDITTTQKLSAFPVDSFGTFITCLLFEPTSGLMYASVVMISLKLYSASVSHEIATDVAGEHMCSRMADARCKVFVA